MDEKIIRALSDIGMHVIVIDEETDFSKLALPEPPLRLWLVTDIDHDDITNNRDLFVWETTPANAVKHWHSYYWPDTDPERYPVKVREVPTSGMVGAVPWEIVATHIVKPD